jgi:hypothetical protein
MTLAHADLEAYLGEAAAYFPATATTTIPSAAAVDAWLAALGPVANIMSQYNTSSVAVALAIADDMLQRWQWRKRMYGAASRSSADWAESWPSEPRFPSPRTLDLIRMEGGAFTFHSN